MLKLSQKKRKALLALAVAATVLGANNAFAASVHDKAISESNNYGSSMRTYWKNAGVYDAKTHTYTFNEDITLKPKTSEQDLNFWTPLFGGIYVAGYNPVTIDMQGHRLDVAMNMDPVAKGTVFNPGAISPHAIHVTSSSLTINNVKGMELSAAGPGLATGNINGIYLAGTNQQGTYNDGKGLSSLTINNEEGWDNAIKFHSSQVQVENGIYVWKNSGSADLKISGLVDMYVGNGSDVITIRGGDYTGDTQGVPTAYIGGGAFKTSTGRAANVVGGLLSVNSKLENGEIVASDANRDVQIDGNIRVGDVGRDQGTVTLGLNTADSYFKGIMYTNGGEGDAHMILQNGAQWTNTSTSQGDYDYHGSRLKQFVGSEGTANTGYIFQNDKAELNLGNYSGYTSIFYEHKNDGTATADYTAGNTIVDTAKVGSNITLITDNVDVNNEKTVNAALNALAGKLYYNAAKNGEGALDGMAVIAEGLTASSKALKTAGIYFNDQTGQGTTTANINQTKTDFTTTLTGVQDNDTEYAEANVIAEDGTYKFKKDTTITTTDKNGADLKQAARINAGKTLTFNTNVEGSDTVYALGASSADGVTVNAGKLVINGSSTNGRVEGINVGQGAQSKDKPMKLTINGDTEFNMKGIGYTLGLYANGNSEVTFNGNVTAMGNENSEWGLTSEEGAFGYYGCSLVYSGSNYSLQMGPKVTINGDVNAKIDGNALFANGGHAKLTINGGGNIEINKDNEHNYYAMIAESGTTSMNVNLDENYDAVSARDNKLVLKGNVGASTGAINANEPELYTKVNLGLATADSVWTGVAHNGFKDEGNKAGDKTFYGAINVFLQNGATWNNEEWGETATPWGGTGFEGSHVAKFVGGVSDAKAGNIFQNDSNNLTIDNYSGNTNIFYAHTGNGEAAENYAAGDTIIKAAAKDSVVSLITDNTGVAMDNKDSVANVLNALAGKLTYSNFTKGEKNLTGYVKIADGLTASSKAKYSADITFNESGKGTYDKDASVMPDHQVKTEFTTTLTGVKADDGEYVAGGVFVKDGSYKFTEDSSITTDDKSSIDLRQAAIIDAEGKTLTLNANSSTGSTVYGLGASSADGVTVNAGKLVINGSSTNGRVEGINVGQGAQSKDKPMKLTINGDTEFNMKGIGYTLGLYANGNSEVTFNGNVTAMGNENSEWGLTSEEGAFGYYGCSLVYSGSNYSLQMGPKVTINGDVNAKIDGNALFANGGHAKLTINGGGNIEINKDNEHNYYAMIAESGTTSMNVNLDENYDAVSARDNKLVLKGNVGASTGAINANEPELYTKVNLGLATADSEWTGIAYNGFNDEGNSAYGSDKKFYGAINVFLQNGATWNNEQWGDAVDQFEGSHVAKFVGGESEAKAGNIFQKDSGNLTIDNYSGNTNIFYAHTGNGEAAENYAAGDTIIRSAAEGSVVSMITDNTGIAMDNKDSVNNVLNALAGKLTYSNYVNDENNLTGYVKIADGLTASSKALETGDISFSKEDGKGYYTNVLKPTTIFTTAITGDIEADKEYAANIKDGKYIFVGDSTITVEAATAADIKKALTIDAGDHKLSIIATGGDWAEEKAFKHTASGTTKITAGELVIGKVSDGDYYDRTGISVEDGTVDITAAKTTIYAQNDFADKTYGIHADNGGRIDIHGDLDLKLSNGAPIHGLVAEDSDYANKAASINVDGKVNIDMSGRDGHAVAAMRYGSTVNIGGGSITVWEKQRNAHYALKTDVGTINVNMNADKTAAGSMTTVINGNLKAYSESALENHDEVVDSVINLGLSDKDSSLTGVAFAKDLSDDNGMLKGFVNLYLQNGASWNNQVWGKIDSGFDGSHVAKLAGGASEATAGNIFQKDSRNLTIDNYSGNTNIFYAHEGNGEAASDYAAGDTIIKSAAEGSVVSMITDNTGIAMDNADSVTNVLNALAGKLTYSNYVNGENNLTGYVKIADGLTASSAALKTGGIAFNKEDGKGSYKKLPKTAFTTAITGDLEADTEYAGNIADGKYLFDGDSTITVGAATAADIKKALTIDAADHKLSIIATGGDWAEEKTFKHNASGTTKITAGELFIGQADGGYYDRTGMFVENGTVDITAAKTTVYAQNDFYNVTYGVHASNNNSRVDIHGDLDLKFNFAAPVHGLVADNGAAINVDGKASIDMSGRDGNAVAAINSGSAVNVGGGTIKAWNGQRNTSYGLLADSGIVNVNMNDDKTAAGTVTTVISGNVRANGEDGMINVGLSDKESSLTGVAFSQNNGVINMYLNNGAAWNNQVWGKTDGGFDGSHVAKLAGGDSEATAGNIFQKDSRNLTIDNYSGNTNIFYAHTGNGEAAENYTAGDTIIKGAAAGSVVSMITDNSGINMDNGVCVTNVLKALAGKLTYSNFVNGESNLTGYVKIADGLTASSKAMQTGDISFSSEDGKGSLKDGSIAPGFTYPDTQTPESSKLNSGITGDAKADYQYKKDGILKEDGSYVFTQDPTKIEVKEGAAVGATDKDIVIDTTKAKLELKGATGINAEGANVNIKGNTSISGNVGINAANGNVTLNGSTVISGTDAAINAGENANVNVNGNNSALTVNGSINADGGNITVDSGKASSTIKGDVNAANGGSVVINLTEKNSEMTGGYNVDGNSSIALSLANGATWHLTDGEEAAGMSLLRMAKGAADAGLTINGGATKEATGYLDMTKRTKDLDIAHYSGWETIIYGHENAGADVADYKSGDTIIDKAAKGSGVILSTDNSGIDMKDKNAVEATLKALAQKVTYNDHKANGANLTGKVQIADGLTSSSKTQNIGAMHWDENGKGQYDLDSVNWSQIIEGDYETFVMKGVRSAATTSLHTWRDNMQDTYTGADMADEDGMFAKALGGKTSSDVKGLKDSNTYYGVQVGYDKAAANGWHTGNISFSTENGKGSLESGSMNPGITYPETQKPGSNKLNQGITGNAKDDYQLKMDGILKADGSYVFTQDPTVIEVKEGAAINASASDIVIDTTKAKLELKGAEAGINADGANVNIKGNTNISGATGINAENGNVTLTGSTVINGTDVAINAADGSNVTVDGNNGAITVNGSINANGGNITVDSGKATSVIKGDINAANGGSVAINLTEKSSALTGGYNVDGTSSIEMNLANGATWTLTDGEEATGMSLLRMAKGAADAGLTINGGKTEAEKGFLDMTDRTKTLDIAHYSGWETIFYKHENAGADVADYTGGDTVIAKADKGSGVILSTDNSGITMTDKNAVEATLKALAQKVTYKDHEANGENLTGKVQIAEGLTFSSASKNLGTIHWDENGKGQYDLDSVNWNQIIEGDYETFVMKGVRSAATTSLHTWRDNMQDTYTGADMADEDGMFAKALGGKTSSDVKGLKDSNTYYGVQVGYDKAAANGWHTGVAFDYRNGDSNYLLGGKGDNQMYSLGVYGVKNFENDAFFRVAAKVGRVENEYDVYNEIRSLKLHGDYKANAYGLTMEYGKTFGDEEVYFTPKAQLTWSQVGAKDYTAHTDNATMQISQDSYSSFVGRLGFEAGVKSEKGRVYAGLFAAHEFNGDISASYFANDGDRKHTSFDGEETWMEMKLGGTYDFSNNAHLYADIAKDFNGNFERKWKMNVGLRFEF